jgi:hypothetical protein
MKETKNMNTNEDKIECLYAAARSLKSAMAMIEAAAKIDTTSPDSMIGVWPQLQDCLQSIHAAISDLRDQDTNCV